MKSQEFINQYRAAFGDNAYLPLVFSYSQEPMAVTDKIGGCFFKSFNEVLAGRTISLNATNIGCGGGKFYTGFSEMPERVPGFVSLKEHYKQTPEMVLESIRLMNLLEVPGKWLNIMRVDYLEKLDDIEGLIFLATPDELSGLCGWAFFDNNDEDAVTTIFGSGCSCMFANVLTENRRGGNRCFLGLFDPSVRPQIEANRLGFAIPKSRFDVMMTTINACFLGGSPAWKKVRSRMSGE